MKQPKKEKSITADPPWPPFRYPIFKMLWIASLVLSIGTWMHDVGAAWLMTLLKKLLDTRKVLLWSLLSITEVETKSKIFHGL